MPAPEFLSPGHHCKDAISSLLIELGEKAGNLYVSPTRRKGESNKAPVLAHSTSQLVVCLICT